MRGALGPALRRAVTMLAGIAAVAALVPTVALPAPAGASGASGTRPSYLAAAEYFGDGNPTNLWSSDLSGAPKAFALMKQDGFNTVGLVLPWGGFQPHLTPPRFNAAAFARLDRLIVDASRLHMGVVLRLSYEFDKDPADQWKSTRFDLLWSNPKVYAAWLDYVAAVHRNVIRYHNVRAAYISWEDLWEPIFQAQAASTAAQRLALATSTGYRSWLRHHYSLAQVEFDYGTSFAGWAAVPTPPPTKPSFKLMYQYQDTALVHRLFLRAAKRFPGLTMETRVDVDSLYTGTTVVGSFTHDAQYRLPGTRVTGMYYAPYMGDPSSTHVETTSQALTALRSTLSRMSRKSGGRPLAIYEYEFVSNSPQVASDPLLTSGQIPTFLAQSEPILHKYTAGYALWTFHDYNLSPLYNQSFALGKAGWQLTGPARAIPGTRSTSYLTMSGGATATQALPANALPPSTPVTISFQARAPSPTTLQVSLGATASTAVQVTSSTWQRYTVSLSSAAPTSIALAAGGSVSVTAVEAYTFTQVGDVYNTTGDPGAAAAPLRSLNNKLTSAG